MKLIFQESINSDIWNWQEVLKNKKRFGMDWLKKFPTDITKKDAKDKKKLKAYLDKKYYRNEGVRLYCEWLQAVMKPEVFDEVVYEVTGKHIPFKIITITPTTYQRCPYDPDKGGFFINYSASPKWIYRTGIHECMHFIIHKYYWKQMIDVGLNNEQVHDIKEALTVLLNPIFIEKWDLPEDGYPNHQNLRKDIDRLSKKTKNFDEIITKTTSLYKRKYSKRVS